MAETTSERARREYEAKERQIARETVSERNARMRAEEAAKALGGMSGKAAGELMGRKSRLDKAIEEAGG